MSISLDEQTASNLNDLNIFINSKYSEKYFVNDDSFQNRTNISCAGEPIE